jgi:hypothetical protein
MKQMITTGENWFVKLPGQKKVSKVCIKELTAKTVAFENPLAAFGLPGEDERYETEDVQWVELVSDRTVYASVPIEVAP